MAESKFIKYQDKNNDGMVDVCDDFVSVEEVSACLDCSPNPNALVDNWRQKTITEPFLNEKICEYQITVGTKYTTTIGKDDLAEYGEGNLTEDAASEAIIERFDEFVEDAIKSLLEVYDKDDSDVSIEAIKEVIDYTEYYLDPRPMSRLKLLYSVPYDDLNALEDATAEDDESDEDDESGDTTVTYSTNELKPLLIRIRKGLNHYNRYLNVYRAMEEGNLYFTSNNSLFDLSLYGDAGFFPTSLLGKALTQLDGFMVQKNYNLPGVGGLKGSRNDRVVKAEFKFNKKFKLKRLKIWTEGCGEKPITFREKLKPLLAQSAWKDPTAMAYFARLHDMDNDFQARTPKPWLEFIKEYTYPPIYDTTNPAITDIDPSNTVISCIGEALRDEGKQLGQDILSDVFSIGDAISLKFHDNICQTSLGEVLDDKVGAGLIAGPRAAGIDTGSVKGNLVELYAMAQEQAFKELDQNDQVFTELCARILFGASGGGGNAVNDIWKHGFDKIKLCGLFDLLMDAIGCLMGGLSLEEALASMLKSAFKAMGIEQFGELFVGLPADKQAELGALVQKKIESGDVFKEGSSGQQISDTIEGKLEWSNPWESEELVEQERENKKEGTESGMTASELQQTSETGNATLTEQFNVGSEANQNQLSPNIVMEAYMLALLELYQDNLLELLDEFNKFPGAPVVAKIIALLDCPRPPIFNPSFMDFIKDLEIPWCNNITDITFPRLENPFGWIPEFKDIMKFIWMALRIALQKLIIKIIMKLLVKICELIGNAICKALETVGDIAAALPSIATGRSTFADVVRESICGPEADEEQVNDTIMDMFNSLGSGGSALADQEQVLAMAEDVSSASTQTEMLQAFSGEPSNEFLNIFSTIIEYEYPDMQAAFPNKEKIGNFFKNCGNLMPADFTKQMKDALNNIPEDEVLPANPSLCATPEQIDQFNEHRCNLLEGRATKEQCEAMRLQPSMLDDLDDLGAILMKGIPNYIDDNMPPLVSDPGCDNGVIPFESEEQKAVVSAVLGGDMEQLKVAFSYDMLGNGPGMKNWGLINMILSDTMGMPFTAHQRKTNLFEKWVNFYVDPTAEADAELDDFAPIAKQRGAYPYKVAELLQDHFCQMIAATSSYSEAPPTVIVRANMPLSCSTTNVAQDDYNTSASFEQLGIDRFGKNIDLLALPDFGYNYDISASYAEESVYFIEKARKAEPDMTLTFQDLSAGKLDSANAATYSFGFTMGMYMSDLYESGGTVLNRPGDNARVKIVNEYNVADKIDWVKFALLSVVPKLAAMKEAVSSLDDAEPFHERAYEFLSVDDTLDGIDLSDYPEFMSTFETAASNYIPQVILLKEILNKNGASVTNDSVKTFHDTAMTTIAQTFASEISGNAPAFTYGASFDSLTKEDVEYVVDNDQTFTGAGASYYEATVLDEDGEERKILNDDMILGISRMQYNEENNDGPPNRVFYLDPAQFGGTYMNPPVYITPITSSAWVGFVDVMFPEISPCKPQRTDLIDFGDIQGKIDEVYPQLPEDERLKSDPDCIKELPYERILERPSVAAIEGLITAGIRAFVSVHFIKAIATFTKFYPKFTETYSSLFAQYIVEDMERHFKSAQKAGWEFFNPFKDSEFWYAFLEQSVQTYVRRMDSEGFTPPQSTYDALEYLSKKVKDFDYYYREDLKEAKDLDEVSKFKTLKNYRSNKNLEFIQVTEEYAKLVLKELVIEQLNYMGEKFVDNLKIVDMKPDVFDLDYYLMSAAFTNDSTLDIAEDVKEEVVDLPTEGEELYTNGTEFSNTETGEMYTGYYHVATDDDGDTVYMAGEFHVEEDHDVLRPLADQVTVPIGDVAIYGESTGTSKPYRIEKYISINGTKTSPAAALETIKANDNSLLISEVYPGTLEHVVDAGGRVVGLTGKLGVRYGLEFSVVMSGIAYPVTTVEVDALDTLVGKIPPFDGDSKLLLCLVNMLKNDDTYKLVAQYALPMKKILSMLAIYNTEAFLPSIGEVTVAAGDAFGAASDTAIDDGKKPGMYIEYAAAEGDDGVSTFSEPTVSAEGWANIDDRTKWPAPFITTYDEWDQVLLRRTKSRLKKLFKTHYNSRDFDLGDAAADKPGKIILNSLRESFKLPPGQHLLPRWQKRMQASNPFDSNGQLCEKED